MQVAEDLLAERDQGRLVPAIDGFTVHGYLMEHPICSVHFGQSAKKQRDRIAQCFLDVFLGVILVAHKANSVQGSEGCSWTHILC